MVAKLIEIFSAIQGEGLIVGTRQIFIRFALCDLRCQFCDSAHTWQVSPTCRVEITPGKRDFVTHKNPVSIADLLSWVERQNYPGVHDSISLTGGEPLLQAPFLAKFLPQLRDVVALPVYLETGGHRPQQLQQIISHLDLVGLDIKLPSVSGECWWREHAECLQLCREANVQVFAKIIVSDRANPEELEKASRLVADIDAEIPVFLQPATGLTDEQQKEYEARKHYTSFAPPHPDRVLEWQALMKQYLKVVRVVPQTHKSIGQL